MNHWDWIVSELYLAVCLYIFHHMCLSLIVTLAHNKNENNGLDPTEHKSTATDSDQQVLMLVVRGPHEQKHSSWHELNACPALIPSPVHKEGGGDFTQLSLLTATSHAEALFTPEQSFGS